jgi:serpin B
MHKVFNKEIYKDDRVAMVKLDYMDSSLSFYAAMAPDNTDLSQYVDKLESKRISLSLPKFKIDSGISLNSAVKALGAGTMFSSNADFSNVFGDNIGLAVSSVIQDTVIDVDEEGTEAASTTMIGMVGTAYNPEQPIEMNFNQPFTYFIMDNDNGEILFMGKFATAQ